MTPFPDGLTPGKVVAVHLNYPSRALQRGRTPSEPSYFLKPATSLCGDGEIIRPSGCELLAYEGEVAAIVAERVRHASPEEGARAIGWYAPANDVGVHDLRWADRGSNVLSKGHDGYTPIGPPVAAVDVDVAALVLRTRVNGEVVQEARFGEVLFDIGQLVADLSRFMTLEPGDVILTGTPAGVGVVEPGDVIEVELEGAGVVRSTVVEADRALAAYGAMPKTTDDARAFADAEPSAPAVTTETLEALRQVSTATLTVQLGKRGIAGTFLAGLQATRPELRLVGIARTLRYVAVRPDVRASLPVPDAQKRIVEDIGVGEVLVMEARGVEDAGTIGDILAARVLARGAAGIVTDGGVRDTSGVTELDIPVYHRSACGTSLWYRHIPMDVDVPITCADVLVVPGDVIVGDGDGVLVVPAALAAEVAAEALEVEEREAFALERVKAGDAIEGIYPLTDSRHADFERWRARGVGDDKG